MILFVNISKDSNGEFDTFLYTSNDDIETVWGMGTKGTLRYIQNNVSWFLSPVKYQQKDKSKYERYYRPKTFDTQINWNDKRNSFIEWPKYHKSRGGLPKVLSQVNFFEYIECFL